MQPILEDSILAKRAAEGTLTIKDVLLYSAVCGTGLDTIPLPGDTTAEQITPLLLDLCALALRLDKPLTARLMPIPGKKAGDETNFDFAFFAPSRIMALSRRTQKFPFSIRNVFHIVFRRVMTFPTCFCTSNLQPPHRKRLVKSFHVPGKGTQGTELHIFCKKLLYFGVVIDLFGEDQFAALRKGR